MGREEDIPRLHLRTHTHNMSDAQKPRSHSELSKEISESGDGKAFTSFAIAFLVKRGQEKKERVCESPQEGKPGSYGAQCPNSTSELVLLLLFLAHRSLW